MTDAAIYEITIGDHYYLGQSIHPGTRWVQHLRALRRGSHYNPRLQRTFDKYGEEACDFRILACMDVDLLDGAEQHLLDKFAGADSCMNIATDVAANMRGRTHTEETKAHLSKTHKERFADPALGERMSALQKTLWQDPEHRAKMSAAASRRWADEELRLQQAQKATTLWENQEYRTRRSKETKELWEDENYRKKQSITIICTFANGTAKQFVGQQRAADYFSVSRRTVVNWLDGRSTPSAKHNILSIERLKDV